ncbi:MAG: group 1 glycosyl [Bacteroidetes bacterium]|nr:MAG: group 1 glycosyl [Bacteroidota bacterium]
MEARKKVVIIGSAYPLRGGGISTFNERLAKAFSVRGDEVIIYTFSLQYPSFLFPGTTQYSTEPPPEGLEIRVRINSINPFNWIKTAFEIAKSNPDLAIFRFWIPFMAPCLGSIARLIKWKTKRRVKIVAITDNIIPHERRPGDRLLVKYFTGSVDAFVAMSESVLRDLSLFDKIKPRAYYPHPLYDNFGAVVSKEIAKQKLGMDESYGYLLFFGFIRDYKGLDLLLEAMSNPKVSDLKIKLLIAGEYYGNEDKYSELISKLGIGDKLVLQTRFIPNSEVYLYFCASDIVVQPYKNATQSGVTQIAYHFGKPMITTRVGGLSEMVPDGKVGYVVEPEQNDIAEAISKFYIGNKEEEFIENVKKEKVRFSWDGLLNTIDNLYKLS